LLAQIEFSESGAGFGQPDGDTKPRIVTDMPMDPGLTPEEVDILASAGWSDRIQSVLVVPVTVDGVVTAFLTLDNFDSSDAFDAEAVEMGRVFAGHVASLIRRFALEAELH